MWTKNYIKDEIIVFVKRSGVVSARLAFDCPRGLRITDRKGSVLSECIDFKTEGREIIALNDKIEYFEEEWLKNKNVPKSIENENELYKISGALLLSPQYLRQKQYLVSYYHKTTDFPNIFSDRINLPRSYEKLLNDKKLKIALMGDSISNAANSSYEMGFDGYKHWLDTAIETIKKQYGAEISYDNISKSGYGTNWAVTAARELFLKCKADLIVIAFGMNDGAGGMSAENFKINVKTLIDVAREINAETEFILVATPLPNAISNIYKTQPLYFDALKQIEKAENGVSVINMTAVSEFLTSKKDYAEISGNNINHPNDFFYAFYSDAFTEIFVRLKEEKQNRLEWSEFLTAPLFEHVSCNCPENVKGGYLINKIDGKIKKTFAFIALPKESKDKKCPALVLVHGAGGNAFAEWAEKTAAHGYVCIAIDVNATSFIEGDADRKNNPDAVIPDIGGFGLFLDGVKESWVYGSVAQIVSACAYLRSLKFVDEHKVGVVGISWGGVLSLIALGSEAKFNAGAIIYSAGFVTDDVLGKQTGIFDDYEKKRLYDTRYDVSAYAEKIDVPVLLTAGLSDGAFSPVSRQRTSELFKVKPETAFVPELWHDNESNFDNKNVISFMDDILKGETARIKLDVKTTNNVVTAKTDGAVDEMIFSFTKNVDSTGRGDWKTLKADINDGEAQINLPADVEYVCVTAYYGNGLFTSSEIKKV